MDIEHSDYEITEEDKVKARQVYTTKPEEHLGKLCGAQLRKRPGRFCKRSTIGASGRCKLHGGLSLKGFDHPNFTHGKISKYAKPYIMQKIKEFEGKDVRNLRNEIAIVRGLLHSYMDKHEDLLNHKQMSMIMYSIKCIEKLVASLKEIEEGQTITIRNLNHIILQVARSIKTHVKDSDARKQIASDLRSLSYVSQN